MVLSKLVLKTMIADIVKVEMQLTTEQQWTELMKRFGHLHCRMLAEKVESHGTSFDHCDGLHSPRLGWRCSEERFREVGVVREVSKIASYRFNAEDSPKGRSLDSRVPQRQRDLGHPNLDPELNSDHLILTYPAWS